MQATEAPPQSNERHDWRRWLHRGSEDFAVLLPMILVNLLVSGFEEYHPIFRATSRWLALATLLLALHASSVSRAFSFVAVLLGLIALLAWRPALLYHGWYAVAVVVCFNGVVALAPIAILRKVWQEFVERGGGREVILGALCAYMYIGSCFAFIYRAVAILTQEPFFVQPDAEHPLNYMYFSFITLTTTGYGDLSPAYGPGRMFAPVEAIIGQLYLVTIVALVVSGFRAKR